MDSAQRWAVWLVNTLVRQLRASLAVGERSPGACFELTFAAEN
jgi:hypothetical protein